MKKIIIAILVVLGMSISAYSEEAGIPVPSTEQGVSVINLSQPPQLLTNPGEVITGPANLIDIPTAYTEDKGTLTVDFKLKSYGGLLFRTYLGLTDFLSLGVATSFSNLIGFDDMMFDTPGLGVMAKVKIYPGMGTIPAITLGYDPFFRYDQYMQVETTKVSYPEGNFGRVYLVTSSGWNFVGLLSHLHFGINTVLQNNPNELWYKKIAVYTGADVMITPEFAVMGEIDKINFWSDEFYMKSPNYNFGVRYTIAPLSVELDFRYVFLKKDGEKNVYQFERNIKIDYTTKLF